MNADDFKSEQGRSQPPPSCYTTEGKRLMSKLRKRPMASERVERTRLVSHGCQAKRVILVGLNEPSDQAATLTAICWMHRRIVSVKGLYSLLICTHLLNPSLERRISYVQRCTRKQRASTLTAMGR